MTRCRVIRPLRHADLPKILARYQDAEFKWGELDCCLFAADVLKELHGVDYAATWRGRYSSCFGALRMIARHGSLAGLVSSVFGNMQPPLLARRGDLVIAAMPEGDAVGIADGNEAAFMSDKGLVRVPLKLCKGSWSV